jgi:protein TonB
MHFPTYDSEEQRASVGEQPSGDRARRLLVVFLAGSTAVHAVIVGVMPGFSNIPPVPPTVLEVLLQQPKPLPVAPPKTETPPPVKRKSEPQRKPEPAQAPVKTQATAQAEQPAPILSLPALQSPAENTFTVPVPKTVEAPPAPAQKPHVASVAATPPAFNAGYLRNPAPRYPLAARRFGEQGTVMLRVLVTAEGLPARVDLEKTSGSMHLDSAAIEAVKGWRFTPARRGNEAVEGWVLVPIVFRLEG